MGHGTRFGFVLCILLSSICEAAVYREKFLVNGRYLVVEVLQDNLLHFELSAKAPGPNENEPITTTPMVVRKDFSGPEKLNRLKHTFETKKLTVDVNESSLCVKIQDKVKQLTLTEICPSRLDQFWKGITLSRANTKNLYGLGQEFRDPGSIDGDWMGRVRHFGGLHGNKMVHFNGGDNGNTQIPILYGLGEGNDGFGLFLDQVYQQQWDFRATPWTAEMYGDHIRWYFFTGNSMADLRKTYMSLVGHPTIPPKKAFGLWLSEYGYRDWGHLESRLTTMRQHHFPIDGFMLDLYWFGGIKTGSDDTAMGRLDWDLKHFPNPKEKMTSLASQGIGIIPIEESYIGKNLAEHRELEKRGLLVKDGAGKGAAYIHASDWWGRGDMMDWTNPATNDFWHHWKRLPLIEAGIVGHWIDLGEPEIYPHDGTYHGGRQADVHNIYNLKWSEGIYQGYQKYSPEKRPFVLSRSGAAGIQRYGTVMWSGDIGSDLSSLASHQNAQMHMSLSGIDYYGADIGGFHREGLQGGLDEMYTQWFAYGALFDVPGRPHTENLCQCKETAPDRIGDLKSNLENVRLRYRLLPYVYSLAHLAHQSAEPVFAPLVYYFQSDLNVRTMAREKMIGPSLLAAVVAKAGQTTTDVYLPEGKWFDFHSGKLLTSRGQKFPKVPLYVEGKYRLPLYARAGAIIPMMHVDDKTMDTAGKRTDGSVRNEINMRVYPSAAESSFTLYEDDGASTGYLRNEVRRTRITQRASREQTDITIDPSSGTYENAPDSRGLVLDLIREGSTEEVLLNGQALDEKGSWEEWDNSKSGWYLAHPRRLYVKSAPLPVESKKTVSVR